MNKLIKYVVGLPKSIYVNFRLCKFSDAIKLPIIVSSRTKLYSLTGGVSFDKIKQDVFALGLEVSRHMTIVISVLF